MRYISILGDSISTFEGYNPDGYTVFYDTLKQQKNSILSVNDTWWSQVIRALGGSLCVNNSFSGSKVSGTQFPAACSEERCRGLHTETVVPDIVLVFMGSNDFGYGVPVKRKLFSFQKDANVFSDAYRIMLSRLKRNYPQAAIVCATLPRSSIQDQPQWPFPERFAGISLNDYNSAIRLACNKERCFLADLTASDLYYETLDGSHPTLYGHSQLADAWISCLNAHRLI